MAILDIQKSVVVDLSRADTWDLLTTVNGVTSFLAPGAHIDLFVGGDYTLAFDANGEKLEDGGEVLNFSFQQEVVFAFHSPSKPKGLDHPTRVHLALEPLADDRTRVVLIHERFGDGEAWDTLKAHCDAAWDAVLDRLWSRAAYAEPAMDDYEPFWAGLA